MGWAHAEAPHGLAIGLWCTPLETLDPPLVIKKRLPLRFKVQGEFRMKVKVTSLEGRPVSLGVVHAGRSFTVENRTSCDRTLCQCL